MIEIIISNLDRVRQTAKVDALRYVTLRTEPFFALADDLEIQLIHKYDGGSYQICDLPVQYEGRTVRVFEVTRNGKNRIYYGGTPSMPLFTEINFNL